MQRDNSQALLSQDGDGKPSIQNSDFVPRISGRISQPVKFIPPTQQEIEIQDEKVRLGLCVFFVKSLLSFFENKFENKAGHFLMFTFTVIIGISLSLSSHYLKELSGVEKMYIPYLVCFFFIFHMIRRGDYDPYLKDQELNLWAKLSGLFVFLSVILLFYSASKISYFTSIFIYLLSWVVVYLGERMYYVETFNQKELFTNMFMTLGVYFLLDPIKNFTVDDTQIKNSQIRGVAAAGLGAVLLGFAGYNYRKINKTNPIILSHIQSLLAIVFLPLFFNLQKLVIPTFNDSLALGVFGLILAVSIIIFIRGLQIQKPSRMYAMLPMIVAIQSIVDLMLDDNTADVQQIIGIVIILFGTYFLMTTHDDPYQTLQEAQGVGESDVPSKEGSDVEMKVVDKK